MKANKSSESFDELTNASRPALTPEEDIDECIALSFDLVKRRLKEGTATSQETCYFLKLGSPQAKAEREKTQAEITLLKAKAESIEALKVSGEIAKDAVIAMKVYTGNADEQDEELFRAHNN